MKTFKRVSSVLVLLVLLLNTGVRAQDITTIEIDQATGKMSVNGVSVEEDTLRVATSEKIKLTVVGTNTALYDYKFTGDGVDMKELEKVQDFTKVFGPYVIDIPASLARANTSRGPASVPSAAKAGERRSGAQRLDDGLDNAEERLEVESSAPTEDPAVTAVRARAEELKRELTAVNLLANGDDGVVQIRSEVLTALAQMFTGTKIAEVVTAVSGRLNDPCRRHTLSARLLERYGTLRKAVAALDAALALASDKLNDDARAVLTKGLETGRKALDDHESLLALAYATETLGLSVLDARDTWTVERKPGVTWKSGRSISVVIAPRKTPELARLAKADTTYSVVLMPRWAVRTSVGLAFMYVPTATFPTYNAVKNGDAYQIAELSETGQDMRFNYGFVLGFAWRGLGWNESATSALWLPELTVNPSDNIKAVGLGAGLSLDIFKLGVGVNWTRRKVLDGKKTGDAITDTNVPMRDDYSVGQLYVSFSVIGWQPFVK